MTFDILGTVVFRRVCYSTSWVGFLPSHDAWFQLGHPGQYSSAQPNTAGGSGGFQYAQPMSHKPCFRHLSQEIDKQNKCFPSTLVLENRLICLLSMFYKMKSIFHFIKQKKLLKLELRIILQNSGSAGLMGSTCHVTHEVFWGLIFTVNNHLQQIFLSVTLAAS